MLETPNVPTKGSTLSPAELCRVNGWGVGDRITHDDYTPLVITAIGRKSILVEYPHGEEAEVTWLAHFDWRRVLPDPEPKPHDWAELIADEVRRIDEYSLFAVLIHGLSAKKTNFNAAVQAVVDREKARGGAIEWVKLFGDQHVAIHRGRAAEVYRSYERWRWNVFDRGERTAADREDTEAQAKAAAEAVLRGGAS